MLEATWCEPLTRAGVTYRCLLRDGPSLSVVLDVADEENADLIVLGSRGLGGYPQLLLGSTSTQVAQNGHRPVTIVPVASVPSDGALPSRSGSRQVG